MSNRDYIIDIPANGSRQLELNEPHFLFLKDCAGQVIVTIDGQSTVMEKGDKKKFDLSRYTRDVAIRRIAVYVNNPDGHAKRAWFISGQGDFEKIVVTGRVTSIAGLLDSEGNEYADTRQEHALGARVVLHDQVVETAETMLENSPQNKWYHDLRFVDQSKEVIAVASADTIRYYPRGSFQDADIIETVEPISTAILNWPPGVGPYTMSGIFMSAFIGNGAVVCMGRRSTGGSSADNVAFITRNRRRYFLSHQAIHRHQLSRHPGMVFNPYDGYIYNGFSGQGSVYRFSLSSPTPTAHAQFLDPDGVAYTSPGGVLPPTQEYPAGRLIVSNGGEWYGRGAVFSTDGQFIEYFTDTAVVGGASIIVDGNHYFTAGNGWNTGGGRAREYTHKDFTAYGKVFPNNECSFMLQEYPIVLPFLLTQTTINGNDVFLGPMLKTLIGAKLGNFDSVPENYMDFIYSVKWHDGEKWREIMTGAYSLASAEVQDYFQFNHNQAVHVVLRDGLF